MTASTQPTQPATPTPPANQQAPGTDQQGQGQPSASNPWAGLLDVVTPPAGQGQPQQQQQGRGSLYPAPAQPVGQPSPVGIDPGQLADLVGRAVQSAVDRRVNQLTNPQWQQAHGQPPQQQGTSAQTFTQGAVPQAQLALAPSGPSEADQREARMAAREYLGDRIVFGDDTERAVAVDLASALIPGQLLMGMTPNQAAQAVAAQVADRVTSMRRSFEDRYIRALRQRGLLNEPPQVPAAMAGSVGMPQGGLPVSTTNQQQIAAKAAKLAGWAADENQQRGWATTPAPATSG